MKKPSFSELQLLADPTRLRILSLIHKLPNICVCQIIHVMNMPQATISKALGPLKKQGLVLAKREKQWVRYSLNCGDTHFPLKKILNWAKEFSEIKKDLKTLDRIQRISLDKICCNKPWRNKP